MVSPIEPQWIIQLGNKIWIALEVCKVQNYLRQKRIVFDAQYFLQSSWEDKQIWSLWWRYSLRSPSCGGHSEFWPVELKKLSQNDIQFLFEALILELFLIWDNFLFNIETKEVQRVAKVYSQRKFLCFLNDWSFLFRCASISWFEVVSGSVINIFLQLAHLRVFQSYFRCASISWFEVVSGSVINIFLQLAHLRVFQSYFTSSQRLVHLGFFSMSDRSFHQ